MEGGSVAFPYLGVAAKVNFREICVKCWSFWFGCVRISLLRYVHEELTFFCCDSGWVSDDR